MEDLNAQQIVLLTLLVSFVTSIATGITTVALLEQAPDPVTQTINRVVEKTVERVVTEPAENTETIIEKEVVTVVVNEEDLTIEAVDKNSRSLVRIYSQTGDIRNLVALGVVFNTNGDIVTDSGQLVRNADYIGVYQSGEYPLVVNDSDSESRLITMSIDGENPVNFSPADFTNSDNLKLGQSVISLSGETQNTVSTGIINQFVQSVEGIKTHIKTSVDSNNVMIGSVILNLSGEIIGMKIEDQSGLNSFVPSNAITQFLASGELSFARGVVADNSTTTQGVAQ
jgi:hypothetical protein